MTYGTPVRSTGSTSLRPFRRVRNLQSRTRPSSRPSRLQLEFRQPFQGGDAKADGELDFLGGEFIYGGLERKNGSKYNVPRIQLSATYYFNKHPRE
jgi:hypothetical protein